jgi:hypothetical protein
MLTSEDIKNLFLPLIGPSLTLEVLVAKIANVAVAIAGVLAFFFLIYAGILYITAGNNPDQAKKAQGAVVNVIIGIIIIALSYMIVRLVGSSLIRIIK